MAFFPLKYTATIQRDDPTTDVSGQQIQNYVDNSVVKCLYLTTSGNKKVQQNEAYEAIVAFYVGPLDDIQEGDLVLNIKDRKGTVVEPGPFEVLSVKRVPGFSGSLHHQSCKLRGVA